MTKTLSVVADCYQLIATVEQYFFPSQAPHGEGFLAVSELHQLCYAEYGNLNGLPVMVFHGGPGGGTGINDARFFDPQFYRVILFDQRGAGRSRPSAEIVDNSTAHLIADIEQLREHLAIDRFLIFGGSWGSALALAYGQAHPDRVLGFILRGIFLATARESFKLWQGMGDTYPEAFDEYARFIPAHERHDLMTAYHRRLVDQDPKVHLPAARAFCRYDFTCATLMDKSTLELRLADDQRVLALARVFAHYSVNQFFLDPDQLHKNLGRIKHLPAIIVHGRYDVITRVSEAFKLYQEWPDARLTIVQDAGHSNQDVGMVKALVEATNDMKKLLS